MTARPVLGLGGTVDFELDLRSDLLDRLVAELGISVEELATDLPIETLRDAVVVLVAHVAEGVGGEHFIADSHIAHELAARFPHRTTLGGTCVRAAIALDLLGVPSAVHLVSIDDTVRRLLPGSVSWVCSAAHDSTDPHVIVQFPPGFAVTVGGRLIVAPAGDRVILANDPPHRELLIAEGLGDLIAAADVIVHSSFNVIQDDEVLRDRIGAVLRHQRRRASGSIVFFEDAAYHRPALAAVVRQLLVPSVDVWSMNETEASAYLGRRIDTADTAAVLPALRELHRMFPVPTLIVHSARWAVAIGPRAEAYREALLLGTSIAGARYRVGDALTAADVIDVLDGERQHEGLRLAEALAAHPDIVVVAAPAVDTPQPTTIGLGDTFVGGMVAALSIGLAAARANLETA